MSVAGKVVLVTGASRGIGAATALELARGGARVVAGARSLERLQEVASRAPHAIVPVTLDVRLSGSVDAAFGLAVERFGGLDAVVNNAAIGFLGPIERQSDEEWREVLETNVGGTLRCCRAAIPLLERRGGGTIVNVSSAAAGDGFPRLAAYSGSKAAIEALSESLRSEVKDRGIRVSVVRIHHVISEFLAAYDGETIGEATALWMKEGLLAERAPMDPKRVADVIAFLIGLAPEASVHSIDVRALGS